MTTPHPPAHSNQASYPMDRGLPQLHWQEHPPGSASQSEAHQLRSMIMPQHFWQTTSDAQS
jgi:hypothetical protein